MLVAHEQKSGGAHVQELELKERSSFEAGLKN